MASKLCMFFVCIEVERATSRNLVMDVTIALTLECGARRQKVMKADTTLANMIRNFQEDNE